MLSFCRLCFSGLMFVLHWANSASSQVQNQRDTINGLYLCFCIVITLWLGLHLNSFTSKPTFIVIERVFLTNIQPNSPSRLYFKPKEIFESIHRIVGAAKPLNKEKNDHKLTNIVNNWYVWTRIKGAFFTKQNFNSWKKKNRNWK